MPGIHPAPSPQSQLPSPQFPCTSPWAPPGRPTRPEPGRCMMVSKQPIADLWGHHCTPSNTSTWWPSRQSHQGSETSHIIQGLGSWRPEHTPALHSIHPLETDPGPTVPQKAVMSWTPGALHHRRENETTGPPEMPFQTSAGRRPPQAIHCSERKTN